MVTNVANLIVLPKYSAIITQPNVSVSPLDHFLPSVKPRDLCSSCLFLFIQQKWMVIYIAKLQEEHNSSSSHDGLKYSA